MENTRIGAIDIAKGIGIILVIVGHALPLDNIVRVFVYTFHMPLFFILTGMVMKSPERDKTVFEDFCAEKKLIRAYGFYSLVFLLFDIIVRFTIQGDMGFKELVWNLYQTVVFFGINVLWFLANLVLAKVLVKRICRVSVNKVYWLVAGISLYAACCMISVHIQWLSVGRYRLVYYPLVAVLRAASSVVYILLGYMAGGKVKQYIKKHNMLTITCITLCALILLLCIFRFGGNVNIHVVRMGNWPIAFVCAILGFAAVFGISILLDRVRGIRELLCYLGTHSLFIMATHEYLKIKDVIYLCLLKLNLLNPQNSVLLQILVLIIIECILCKLCSPYVDRIISLNCDNSKRKLV